MHKKKHRIGLIELFGSGLSVTIYFRIKIDWFMNYYVCHLNHVYAVNIKHSGQSCQFWSMKHNGFILLFSPSVAPRLAGQELGALEGDCQERSWHASARRGIQWEVPSWAFYKSTCSWQTPMIDLSSCLGCIMRVCSWAVSWLET